MLCWLHIEHQSVIQIWGIFQSPPFKWKSWTIFLLLYREEYIYYIFTIYNNYFEFGFSLLFFFALNALSTPEVSNLSCPSVHFSLESDSKLVPCFLVELSMKDLPQTPFKSSRNKKSKTMEVEKKKCISLDKWKISTAEHPVPYLALWHWQFKFLTLQNKSRISSSGPEQDYEITLEGAT